MTIEKKVIEIFIAYISDVEDAVKIYRDLEKSINNEISSTKLRISIKTWKDLPNSFGNAQMQINNGLVEKCDIFIGVLGNNWGTPTGQCDCGIKEEYEIVAKRRKNNSPVEIWMYKKESDNSPTIQDVKELALFVEQIKNECLMRSFKNDEDFEKTIHDRIVTHLFELISNTENDNEKLIDQGTGKSIAQPEGLKKGKAVPKDIAKASKIIYEYSKNADLKKVDLFSKIRLFLLSKSMLNIERIYSVLDNHENQLIYLEKR